jgi:lipopolysaccharide export LptBFGC system permease protein LptF
MKKTGIIIAILLVITGCLIYSYMYQEHRNILKENAEYSISSSQLYEEFYNSYELANKKFINTVVEFHGPLSQLDNEFIIIHPKIVCKLDSNFSTENLILGDSLLLKGRCIGFDDLFMEVKMDNVSFMKR